MRAVIQRVNKASVEVDQKVIASIEQGLFVLLGIEQIDEPEDIDWLVKKILQMRIFGDKDGKMNLSVSDIEGEILVVSQFTLHASTKKGNRPSFIKAAKPDFANKTYLSFIARMKTLSKLNIQSGIFGAMMNIDLINEGPVTIIIDSKNKE